MFGSEDLRGWDRVIPDFISSVWFEVIRGQVHPQSEYALKIHLTPIPPNREDGVVLDRRDVRLFDFGGFGFGRAAMGDGRRNFVA